MFREYKIFPGREERFHGQLSCRNLPYNFPLSGDSQCSVASYENAVCLGLTQHFNLVWLESFSQGTCSHPRGSTATSPPAETLPHWQLIFLLVLVYTCPCGSLSTSVFSVLRCVYPAFRKDCMLLEDKHFSCVIFVSPACLLQVWEHLDYHTVSPLLSNLQVANFQRCVRAFARPQSHELVHMSGVRHLSASSTSDCALCILRTYSTVYRLP